MLVLSRKRDEAIRIGDNIKIIVVDIWGDKVRIGIHAPGQAVHRQEVYDKISGDGPPIAPRDGYLYLHKLGGIYPTGSLFPDAHRNPLLVKFWPYDKSSDACKWNILVEASVRGATPEAITRLLESWQLPDESAITHAKSRGITLKRRTTALDRLVWYALRPRTPGPTAYTGVEGGTPLEALVGLAKLEYYRGFHRENPSATSNPETNDENDEGKTEDPTRYI